MSDSSTHGEELRRSLLEATSRIEAIIDEAETTATSIRGDAERDAATYRQQKAQEIDAQVSGTRARLDEIMRSVHIRLENLGRETDEFSSAIQVATAQLADGGEVGGEDASGAMPQPSPAGASGVDAGAPAPDAAPPVEEAGTLLERTETNAVPVVEPTAEADAPATPIDAGTSAEVQDMTTPVTERSSDPGPRPVAYPGTGGPAADEAEDRPSTEDALLRVTQLAVSGSTRPEIAEVLRNEFNIADVESVLDGILGPKPS